MKKIVINKGIGGFGLNLKGQLEYLSCCGKKAYVYQWVEYAFKSKSRQNKYVLIDNPYDLDVKDYRISEYYILTKNIGREIDDLPLKYIFSSFKIDRTDNCLIRLVEKFGNQIADKNVNLRIVEIGDNEKYEIIEFDNIETLKRIL